MKLLTNSWLRRVVTLVALLLVCVLIQYFNLGLENISLSVAFVATVHVGIVYLTISFLWSLLFKKSWRLLTIAIEFLSIIVAIYFVAPYYYNYLPCYKKLSKEILDRYAVEIDENKIAALEKRDPEIGGPLFMTNFFEDDEFRYAAKYGAFYLPPGECQIYEVYKIRKAPPPPVPVEKEAEQDRPPEHKAIEMAFFKCEKCKSLEGGIYGKGPFKSLRSPQAKSCVHKWEKIGKEEFRMLGTKWQGIDWTKEIPFWNTENTNTSSREAHLNKLRQTFKLYKEDMYKAWNILKTLKASDGIYGIFAGEEIMLNYLPTGSRYPQQISYNEMYRTLKEKSNLDELKRVFVTLKASRINLEKDAVNLVILGGGVLGSDEGYICGIGEADKKTFDFLSQIPEDSRCYYYID